MTAALQSTLTFAHHQVDACAQASRPPTIFVGEDWLLSSDDGMDYRQSEAIGPCLMFAEPGAELSIEVAGRDEPVVGRAVLHAPGTLSAGITRQTGGICLYFDPLSASGRAITRLANAQGGIAPWDVPSTSLWSPKWYEDLRVRAVDPAQVNAFVAELQGALTNGATREAIGWHLRTVADMLAEDPSGRLSAIELSKKVFWSAAHLRKAFHSASGMTLSRYQVWQRVHLASRLACKDAQHHETVRATATMHDAGFYDAAHGCRTIRQYFGMSPSVVMQPALYCASRN